MVKSKDLTLLEERIGYVFNNKKLLKTALSHSSYVNESNSLRAMDNERLEFLGDAVLELVISEYIYLNNPDWNEGKMTKKRAAMVCEESLFSSAENIGLGDYLFLGKGEAITGGRKRPSLLSDAFESLIAAIFLDGGIDNAKKFVYEFIIDIYKENFVSGDYKSALQEYVQGKHAGKIVYELVKEEGPDHDRTFTYSVYVGEKKLATESGNSKKTAQRNAAAAALAKLQKK